MPEAEAEAEAAKRRREAETALRRWADVHERRDELIREAADAGVTVRRIHALTGVARTTIARILTGSDSR